MTEPTLAGLRIGLIGPLPPPTGGMANQTRQLGEMLTAAANYSPANSKTVFNNSLFKNTALRSMRLSIGATAGIRPARLA